MKPSAEAITKVFKYLLEHQQAIVAHGFSDEVVLTMGDTKLVLRGKGRDLDKAKKKAKG